MGSLTIINALGADTQITEANPYNFSPQTIPNGAAAYASSYAIDTKALHKILKKNDFHS
ncbi:hypothetical protein ACFQNF_07490 [Iodobacter arcticus]|uniref:Uncharacterized protein n=1 Tax=Iodobacter arcticus TaxID=590593 RepID=A0ABW2R0R7_9NEIS